MKAIFVLVILVSMMFGQDSLYFHDNEVDGEQFNATYRGTFFELDEPGTLSQVKVWFGEDDLYWDTYQTEIQVYLGTIDGPTVFRGSETVTVVTGESLVVDFNVALTQSFWIIQNTEMSDNGFPNIAIDTDNNGHSFRFNSIGGDPIPSNYEFMITAIGSFGSQAFSQNTWAGIKTSF